MRRVYFILILSLVSSCRLITHGFGHEDSLQKAEEFLRQERFDEAIAAYHRHIDFRLSIKNRPEWENPNFYLLMIGDVQLNQGKIEEAISTYQEAEKNGIEQTFISDRYRSVAAWLEKRDRLKEAVDILSKRRDLDPILIDSVLDRLSKELVLREDSQSQSFTGGNNNHAK